ncbi:MAG: cyclic nucleotide-binding domain-containing protein [Burkholderiales bacterium]|nr:cyclic nucleotide-binding domain-containing protein [Burkholderiales bacterium]
MNGEVEVSLSDKPISNIQRGGVFGELLYFSQRLGPRTTTIQALGELTVIEIKSKALQVASPACQVSFQKAFMRVLINRLTEVNAKLAASR